MVKLEATNKQALRLVLNKEDISYKDLCKKADVTNICLRCIKAIAILMYKIKTKKKEKTPNYIHDLFSVRQSQYNIRDADLFNILCYNTVAYGKKSSYY